jgi:hypothetical protein
MPIYCYKKDTGEKIDIIMSCDEKEKQEFVHEDGRVSIKLPDESFAFKDIARQFESVRPRERSGCWPMHSDAAGVHVTQIKQAYEHSVKIGCKTEFDNEGRAIFTSPQHRKRYCRAIGLCDRNAGYSDPEPIGKADKETETETIQEYNYG